MHLGSMVEGSEGSIPSSVNFAANTIFLRRSTVGEAGFASGKWRDLDGFEVGSIVMGKVAQGVEPLGIRNVREPRRARDIIEEENLMNSIAKLGLAAALVVGSTGFGLAEDAAAKAGVKAGVGDAAVGASVDATATGSVGNYGSVISGIQSSATADLTAFNDQSTVNCVGVSTLQGDATNNAQALDNAISKNQEGLTTFRSSLQSNTALWTKLESSCTTAQIQGLTPEKILAVQSGADGSFTFYIDDRA